MKQLHFFAAISFVSFALALFFMAPAGNENPSIPKRESADLPTLPQKVQAPYLQHPNTRQSKHTDKRPSPQPQTKAEQLTAIILGGSSGSDKYRLIVDRLKTDEAATLALLAEKEYPHGEIDTYDPRYEEIAMIARAFNEAYQGRALTDVLDKFDVLRPSGMLYSTVVNDAFLHSEGLENATTAYDWVMANPLEAASSQAGITIGGKLADYDPDFAWDKSQMLPEGSIRSGALASVISVISTKDKGKAELLVRSMAPSKDLDRAISDLVALKLASGDPFEHTVELAVSPTDLNYRIVTLTHLFREWASHDAAALRHWLEADHTLPNDKTMELRLLAKQALQSSSG